MAIDERSRHELYLRLEEVLGEEPANTMMEHLPPVGWADVATKRDLDGSVGLLRHDMTAEFEAAHQEMASEFKSVRQEMGALRQEMAAEFNSVRQETQTMRHDIVGTLRAEFMSQTRTMFLAIVTIVLTMAGLTFGLVVTLVP